MPELPDILAYLTALEPRIVGQQLLGVRIASHFLLRTFEPPIAAAKGKTMRGLRRLGKRIVLELEDDLFLVLHLMIAGRLHWKAGGNMSTSHRSKALWLAIALALGLGVNRSPAQTLPNGVMVAVGAGFTGNWNTEIEIANATGSRVNLQLNTTPKVARVCPIGGCPGSADIAIPPRGSAKAYATDVHGIGNPLTFLGSLYLVSEANAAEESVVRARVFNIAAPTQSIEIPVFRLSTLLALGPSVLAFPSATRSESAHSNLVLAEVSNAGTLSMLVEAFSASGQLVGSRPVAITADPLDVEHRALFLVDVLSQLGVTQLEIGQIRVTKTGGDGVMWGLLATVHRDGRVIVSVGKNP